MCSVALTSCALPVLRTYWYDGAKKGIATPSQQTIAALPNVKLRLGRLNTKGEQKGVDALIYRDLMTLARERAVSDAFLLSGDEDLREGVRAAQDMGVRVTLVGIPPTSQSYNQSRELVNEADEVVILTKDRLAPFFTLLEPQSLSKSTATATTPAPLGIESETDLVKLRAAGGALGETWWAKATEIEQAALVADRPRIPRTLDMELLLAGEASLGTTLRGRDEARRALRKGFWRAISVAPPTSDQSPGAGDSGSTTGS
jgi:hypothetical protein